MRFTSVAFLHFLGNAQCSIWIGWIRVVEKFVPHVFIFLCLWRVYQILVRYWFLQEVGINTQLAGHFSYLWFNFPVVYSQLHTLID